MILDWKQCDPVDNEAFVRGLALADNFSLWIGVGKPIPASCRPRQLFSGRRFSLNFVVRRQGFHGEFEKTKRL
jgi:hypothetical protein